MCMRKQMMNIYQSKTLCAKFFNRRESMLAEVHACLHASAGCLQRRTPAADSRDLGLGTTLCPDQ